MKQPIRAQEQFFAVRKDPGRPYSQYSTRVLDMPGTQNSQVVEGNSRQIQNSANPGNGNNSRVYDTQRSQQTNVSRTLTQNNTYHEQNSQQQGTGYSNAEYSRRPSGLQQSGMMALQQSGVGRSQAYSRTNNTYQSGGRRGTTPQHGNNPVDQSYYSMQDEETEGQGRSKSMSPVKGKQSMMTGNGYDSYGDSYNGEDPNRHHSYYTNSANPGGTLNTAGNSIIRSGARDKSPMNNKYMYPDQRSPMPVSNKNRVDSSGQGYDNYYSSQQNTSNQYDPKAKKNLKVDTKYTSVATDNSVFTPTGDKKNTQNQGKSNSNQNNQPTYTGTAVDRSYNASYTSNMQESGYYQPQQHGKMHPTQAMNGRNPGLESRMYSSTHGSQYQSQNYGNAPQNKMNSGYPSQYSEYDDDGRDYNQKQGKMTAKGNKPQQPNAKNGKNYYQSGNSVPEDEEEYYGEQQYSGSPTKRAPMTQQGYQAGGNSPNKGGNSPNKNGNQYMPPGQSQQSDLPSKKI